ncbi:MAG: efflux RND transporter periplasmic adaptor subunit [Gammaproteobacteria bacterium]
MADAGHGDETPSPTAITAPEPRVTASSSNIEWVGIVRDHTLWLYVDRYATNEPLAGARIMVTNGSASSQAKPEAAGLYSVKGEWLGQPGRHDIHVTVEAEGISDALSGSLEIPGVATETKVRHWQDYAKWAGLAVVGLVLLVIVLKWRKGAAAVSLFMWVALSLNVSDSAFAHGDEDHGDNKAQPETVTPARPAATGAANPAGAVTSAKRLPDGSLFLPKPAQHLLNIRTQSAEVRDISRTVELNGQIISDPNYSGRVQATQAGRMDAPEQGLPHSGQAVKKGEILAYLTPIITSLEKGAQQVQLAEINANLSLAEKKVQRLEQLIGSIPQKELDAARAELKSLRERKAAVSASTGQPEALRAPVSGMIHHANLVAGQIVEAREVLFEIIDPSRLWVEAVSYDPALADQVKAAYTVLGEQTMTLAYLGQAFHLHGQALPMQFKFDASPPDLSVGQPLKIYVETKQSLRGIVLPQESVIKGSGDESLIWVHAEPEHFTQKKVRVQKQSNNSLAILEGLEAGERVVTEGAALLGQFR